MQPSLLFNKCERNKPPNAASKAFLSCPPRCTMPAQLARVLKAARHAELTCIKFKPVEACLTSLGVSRPPQRLTRA